MNAAPEPRGTNTKLPNAATSVLGIHPVQGIQIADGRTRRELLLAVGCTPDISPLGDQPCQTEEANVAAGRACIQWTHSTIDGQTEIVQINATTFEIACRLRFKESVKIDQIGWSISMELASAQTLDSRYRWQACSAKSRTVDAWTPLAIQGEAAGIDDSLPRFVQVVGLDRLPVHELRHRNHQLQWSAWLDHQAAHPRFTFVGPLERNWHNQYTYEPEDQIEFTFRLLWTDQPSPVLVPGRYPGRRRGLVCITDHADHDTCERFAALMFGSSHPDEYRAEGIQEGFAGLKLPFTKSIFSETNEADGAGLHNPRFVELCDHAHECGIELGPHGVHITRDPDPSEYKSLMTPFEKYKALTWIDHGRSFQCNYGRSGWDPNHTHNLHQMLDQLGLRFLWGRLDFGQAVPNGSLDQLQIDRFSGLNYLRDLPRSAWRALAAGRPWALVHELATLLFQLIPDRAIGQYFAMQGSIQAVVWRGKISALLPAIRDAIHLLMLILTPSNLRQIARQCVASREELRFVPTCFREHSSRHRRPARWLFNTVAVHDVEDAFTPQAIARLLDDYGAHLSHTYLASVSRAHLSHAVRRHPEDRNHWQLTPKFAENLRWMAKVRNEGQLWVASFGEVGTFWEQLATTRIVPETPGVWSIQRREATTQVPVPLKTLDLPLILSVGSDAHEMLYASDSRIELEALHDDFSLGNLESLDTEPMKIVLEPANSNSTSSQ